MSVSSNDVCGVGVAADIQITGMCLSKQERQGAPRPSGHTAAPVLVLPQVPPAFQDELSTQTTGVGARGPGAQEGGITVEGPGREEGACHGTSSWP